MLAREMPGSQSTTFLDLDAGPYRLALAADCVLGVVTNVAAPLLWRGEPLPFCDLAQLFTNAARQPARFAVCFEAEGERVGVGVDRVDHVRVPAGTPLSAVPPFALRQPRLFAGVLRDSSGLMLVLAPVQLAQLTAPK